MRRARSRSGNCGSTSDINVLISANAARTRGLRLFIGVGALVRENPRERSHLPAGLCLSSQHREAKTCSQDWVFSQTPRHATYPRPLLSGVTPRSSGRLPATSASICVLFSTLSFIRGDDLDDQGDPEQLYFV